MQRQIATYMITTLVLLIPYAARAADYLSCQADLVQPDCTKVTSPTDPLHLAATCQECSGGGSDITCSPGEMVTAANLSIVTAADIQPVEGSFAQVGTCGFGQLQFKFSGSLAKGDYLVLVTAPPHEPTEILSFSVGNGSPPPADSGTTPASDGGTTPASDGGGAPSADGDTSAGDGATTGDGDGDDGGCDCRAASGPRASTLPPLLLALLTLLVLRQVRRRC